TKPGDARRIDGCGFGIGRPDGLAGLRTSNTGADHNGRTRAYGEAEGSGQCGGGYGGGSRGNLTDLIGPDALRQVHRDRAADIGADLVIGHAGTAVEDARAVEVGLRGDTCDFLDLLLYLLVERGTVGRAV